MDTEIDIPQYFLCPISLQIMNDPVTTVTGITYDRETIQQWLTTAATCPVTKQPLPHGSDLTPNHMLRRLIQAWCVANAQNGVARIPTPKSPLNRSTVLKLVRDVNRTNWGVNCNYNINAIRKLDELAAENDKNRQCLLDNGVAKAVILFIVRCFREEGKRKQGIEEALRILQLIWAPTSENRNLLEDDVDFVRALLWILRSDDFKTTAKTNALVLLKHVSEIASASLLETLTHHDFFTQIVRFLRNDAVSAQGTKSALQILIQTSRINRNRSKIIEAGAVSDLIEMELNGSPEKRISELILCLLADLCSCAEGRQDLLRHAAGLAVVAKRLLRVSAAADDRAVYVMESIARFSATREVVQEMLRVGAVSKLCMVLQADCPDYLRKKVRGILRLHSSAWSNSPCVQVYLLTMNPR